MSNAIIIINYFWTLEYLYYVINFLPHAISLVTCRHRSPQMQPYNYQVIGRKVPRDILFLGQFGDFVRAERAQGGRAIFEHR